MTMDPIPEELKTALYYQLPATCANDWNRWKAYAAVLMTYGEALMLEMYGITDYHELSDEQYRTWGKAFDELQDTLSPAEIWQQVAKNEEEK